MLKEETSGLTEETENFYKNTENFYIGSFDLSYIATKSHTNNIVLSN